MTINEAIEILSTLSRGRYTGEVKKARDAEKLGIEALICVRTIRHHPFPDTVLQLPGETKGD